MGRSRDLADGTLSELNVDSNTLAVDATNNNVGIGTSSPDSSNKLQVTGDIGLDWATDKFIGMKFGSGGSYKMGLMLKDTSRECKVWSQSVDSDDKITFYTGSTPSERMRIDSSGRVTMPYQPAFRVGDNCSIDGSGYFYNFTYTDFNVGSHYNNSTGKFTAPVSGLYYFFYSLYNGGSCTFEIRKNGSKIAYNDGSNGHPGVSALTLLSTNDYVQIYKFAGPNGNGNDFFIGCLLG